MSSIRTEDIVIGTEWTKVEMFGSVMLVSKSGGSGARFRFGVDSTSNGIPLGNDTLILDQDIWVRAVTNTVTLAVSR